MIRTGDEAENNAELCSVMSDVVQYLIEWAPLPAVAADLDRAGHDVLTTTGLVDAHSRA